LQRTPVSSSNLRAVGYDPATRVLEVEFLDGGAYQYSGVPASVYAGLMSASSHGSYFDQHVKKAGYPYRRI
jgi:KTSC domain